MDASRIASRMRYFVKKSTALLHLALFAWFDWFPYLSALAPTNHLGKSAHNH